MLNPLISPARKRGGIVLKAICALIICGWSILAMVACGGRAHSVPLPAIEHFQADRTPVELGSEVSLEARFANGSGEVDHDGGVLPGNGTVKVAPVGTTTYTLTVTNADGRSVRRQTTVEVKPGLAIKVDGPEGLAGEATVSGPEGYARTVTGSALLTGLQPGDYTISAAPVRRGEVTFHPRRPVQRVNVQTGTSMAVEYPAPALSVPLPGGISMDFVLIPGGSFLMGSDHPADPQRFPGPGPAHPVTFAEAFYMARHPTTQAQWEAVTGANPSRTVNPDYAVSSVSFEAIKCRFLPGLNHLVPGRGFRLPSEAEWEYACRAGTTTVFFDGDDPARIWDYAWPMNIDRESGHPVAQKKPNPWGLYDLAGLVFQWCEDLAHDGYAGAPSDGAPWLDPGPSVREGHRIIRGYPPLGPPGRDLCGSSAERWCRAERNDSDDLGFRLAATVD